MAKAKQTAGAKKKRLCGLCDRPVRKKDQAICSHCRKNVARRM